MDNLRGILLLVLAMACFAMEDMFVKTASAHMSIGQILGLLGIGGGIAFAVLAKSSGHRLFSASSLHKTVILRNLGELIGTLSFVTAITTSALSTSTAIFQAAPLATTLCAAVFLKEPVGWRRWSAIAVGFIGVLLIVRPGSASFEPASLFAVGAVVGLAARDVATRVLPRDISSQVIACYAFAVIGITGFALQLFEDTFFVPMDTADWGNIIGALLFGMAGYLSLTVAMRVGEMGVIMPFRYTRLIFAMIIGMTFFGERPQLLTYIGAAIIITSGIYTLFRERKQRLARLSTPSGTR